MDWKAGIFVLVCISHANCLLEIQVEGFQIKTSDAVLTETFVLNQTKPEADIIKGMDMSDLEDEDVEESEAMAGTTPSILMSAVRFRQHILTDSSAACNCKNVLLSSLAGTQYSQPKTLGTYKYYGQFNNRPAYRGPANTYLYFINSGWMVGAHIGDSVGYVYNSKNDVCPYLMAENWWMYYDGTRNLWYYDTTLVYRCIQ